MQLIHLEEKITQQNIRTGTFLRKFIAKPLNFVLFKVSQERGDERICKIGESGDPGDSEESGEPGNSGGSVDSGDSDEIW